MISRLIPSICFVLAACADPAPTPPAPELEPALCPLHDVPLQNDDVPIVYGLVHGAEPWADRAPYALLRVYGGCVVREEKTARVQYCPECRRVLGYVRRRR